MQMLVVFSVLSSPFAAVAGEWIVSPSVAIDEVYTDNAELSSEDKQEEYITRVRPSISLYREGARANLDLNYSPEFRYYKEETNDNETVHQLRVNGDVEFVENHLFADAWATSDQTRISSRSASPDGLTGESIDYYTVGVSPYYTTRFGNTSVLESRYTADKVDYDDPDNPDPDEQDDPGSVQQRVASTDSTSQEFDLILGSGTYSTTQVWELSASHTIEDFTGTAYDGNEISDKNKISIFRGEFLQQISRRWALAFAAGYEEFDLSDEVTDDSGRVIKMDEDGELWSIGVVFTPTNRTRMALGVGERAFGDDYYFNFEHRASRSIWRLDYKRDYISARDEAIRPTLFQRQDEFGNVVRDAVLDNPPSVTVTGVSTLSAEYYEIDRLTAAFIYRTQRSRAELTAGLSKRDYETIHDTRDLTSSISFHRMISSKLSSIARLHWTDHEEEQPSLGSADTVEYKEWSATLGVNYILGTDTTISTSVTHLDRDAVTDNTVSYEENRVSLGLSMRF
jgi:uncharacterized protein (PEP-CTERM system associated)